jgi:hypothetical protein
MGTSRIRVGLRNDRVFADVIQTTVVVCRDVPRIVSISSSVRATACSVIQSALLLTAGATSSNLPRWIVTRDSLNKLTTCRKKAARFVRASTRCACANFPPARKGSAGEPFPDPISAKTPANGSSCAIHTGSTTSLRTISAPFRAVRLIFAFHRTSSSQYRASNCFSAAGLTKRNRASSDSRISRYTTTPAYSRPLADCGAFPGGREE